MQNCVVAVICSIVNYLYKIYSGIYAAAFHLKNKLNSVQVAKTEFSLNIHLSK